MRTIEWTSQFRRDYKREGKGQHRTSLDADLGSVLTALVNDQSLEHRHRDHALTGDWKDFRDCHVKPDLVLIYQKSGDGILRLVRLGSHSELGLKFQDEILCAKRLVFEYLDERGGSSESTRI